MDGDQARRRAARVSVHQQISAHVIVDLFRPPSMMQMEDAEALKQIDHETLVMEMLLYTINRIGLASASAGYALEGATRDEALAFMIGNVLDQASFYRVDISRRAAESYCNKTLDWLLGHGRHTMMRTYTPFGGPGRIEYRLFAQNFAADNKTPILRPTEYAANALFQSLALDVTDANASTRLMIEHHLKHGNYDRTEIYLDNQINVSRRFSAELKALMSRVYYQIRRTRWDDLADTIHRVRVESNETIQQDETIRTGLIEAEMKASDEDRVKLRRIFALTTEAFGRHSEIRGAAMSLHEDFIERRQSIGMRPPLQREQRDFETEILMPLLGSTMDEIEMTAFHAVDLVRPTGLPTAPDPVHWLHRLLLIRRIDDDDGPVDEDADFDQEIEIDDLSLFSEEDELAIDEDLLDYALRQAKSFDLLGYLHHLEEKGAPERHIYLANLFVATIFMHPSRRWQIDLAPTTRSLLPVPRLDDEQRLLTDAGHLMMFDSHQDAARFISDRRLGHAVAREIHPQRSDMIVLRANSRYPQVRLRDDGLIETVDLIGHNFTIRLLDATAPNYEPPEEPDA